MQVDNVLIEIHLEMFEGLVDKRRILSGVPSVILLEHLAQSLCMYT
jgi:hypothetical protein